MAAAFFIKNSIYIGVSSSGKTQHFDCCMRRFESCHPSHTGCSYRISDFIRTLCFFIHFYNRFRLFTPTIDKEPLYTAKSGVKFTPLLLCKYLVLLYRFANIHPCYKVRILLQFIYCKLYCAVGATAGRVNGFKTFKGFI